MESKEGKKRISWGEVDVIGSGEKIPNLNSKEVVLKLETSSSSGSNFTMDADNTVVSEVRSVKEETAKGGNLDSYLSDTSTSNYFKFKSTSEVSLDNPGMPVGQEDSQKREAKMSFENPKLNIVENTEFTRKFQSNPMFTYPENAVNQSKLTSRTLLMDYDEPKDNLDKLWNTKTFFEDMRTDYNFQGEETQRKFDEDFKNNYLRSLNTKRGENGETPESESEDRVSNEFYKFEIEKLKKIVEALKEQITERDERISNLTEKVLEFDKWKTELEPNKQASVVQYKAENERLMAVNLAKLEAQVKENERLTQKLMQMEKQLKDKDDEIKSLTEKVVENELTSGRFDRDLKSLEIDKQMLKNSIQEMEKSFRQREMQMKLNMDVEYQNQLSTVLKEQEQLVTLVSDKDTEIEKCKKLLKTARHECSQLLESILKLKEVLIKKNQQIEHYKNKVIELESKMIAEDKTSELKISREMQMKLRERVRQLEQKLEMMEESLKLENKAREENLYLKSKLEKLENVRNEDEFSQSVMELGNQMMPLSLANLRDY